MNSYNFLYQIHPMFDHNTWKNNQHAFYRFQNQIRKYACCKVNIVRSIPDNLICMFYTITEVNIHLNTSFTKVLRKHLQSDTASEVIKYFHHAYGIHSIQVCWPKKSIILLAINYFACSSLIFATWVFITPFFQSKISLN